MLTRSGGRRIRFAVGFGDDSCGRTADNSPIPRKHGTRATVSRTIAVEHGAKRKSRSNPSHSDSAPGGASRERAPKLNYSEIIFSAPANGRLPSRLGLSLSLGTSRHPRPFDKRFIIKESSSPALIHASLDGVCLIDMGWAVKRLQSLLPLRHPVTSVNTTSTVTRFISSGASCFDRDSTKIHYSLSICLAFAQSL